MGPPMIDRWRARPESRGAPDRPPPRREIAGPLFVRSPGAHLLAAFAMTAGAVLPVSAEPYLAARARLRCSSCHVNMTGGGERAAQGRLYAHRTLPASESDESAGLPPILTGEIGGFLTAGADLRFSNLTTRPPRREGGSLNEFRTDEANLYLTVKVWQDKLLLHLDEKVAPGGALNREAFILCKGLPADGWLKAGRFFPPFGTRLYDDGAHIRSATGYTFQTTDEGVEVGFEPGKSSFVVSITNGAGGGAENDSSKQISAYALRLLGRYRLGVSASNNVTGGVRTSIGGVFGAAAWGNVVVLAEGDVRDDKDGGRTKEQWIGYVEGDWEVRRGLTLRVTHEYLDPDRDVATDARTRTGLGVAWFPVAGLELDARALRLDGPPQIAGLNTFFYFGGIHLFF